MSSARAEAAGADATRWIPLTRAARLAGCTPYTIKTATIGGLIRAKILTGFPTLYSETDTLAFRQARGA